jgi:hypothetical protein
MVVQSAKFDIFVLINVLMTCGLHASADFHITDARNDFQHQNAKAN